MFTNKIDASFQSMVSKKYGVDVTQPKMTKSLFECLDECDVVERKTTKLNESKCCGKDCDEAVDDELELEVGFEDDVPEDSDIEFAPAEGEEAPAEEPSETEQGEFSNDNFTVELDGENGYKVTSNESGKVYKLVEGKALGGTSDLGATFIVEDNDDEMTCAGFVDTTTVGQDLFDSIFDAISEYESEEDDDEVEDEAPEDVDIETEEDKVDESLKESNDSTPEFKAGYDYFMQEFKNAKAGSKKSVEDVAEVVWDNKVCRNSNMSKSSEWVDGAAKACEEVIGGMHENLTETNKPGATDEQDGYDYFMTKFREAKAAKKNKFKSVDDIAEKIWDSEICHSDNLSKSEEWVDGAEKACREVIKY